MEVPPYPVLSLEQYRDLAFDEDYWRPHIDFVATRHDLFSRFELYKGDRSNIVALSGDRVIKIYPPLFNHHQSAQMEIAVLKWLGNYPELKTPVVEWFGSIYPEVKGSTWPYVVERRVAGVKLEPIWPALRSTDRISLGKEVGEFCRTLHSVPIPAPIAALWTKNFPLGWTTFLEMQVHKTLEDGRYSHLLPQPIPSSDNRCIIHADLEPAHVFVNDPVEASITGVIDFGDVKIGDPAYEFVSLALSYNDLDFFSTLLSAYAQPLTRTRRFVDRFAFYLLVHEWGPLDELKEWVPASGATDFDQWAAWVAREVLAKLGWNASA